MYKMYIVHAYLIPLILQVLDVSRFYDRQSYSQATGKYLPFTGVSVGQVESARMHGSSVIVIYQTFVKEFGQNR